MLDRGDRAGRGHGQRDEVRPRVLHLIAVAHPDRRLARHVVKERLIRIQNPALGPAKLARGVRLDHPSQGLCRELHAITNPQDRNTHPKKRRVAMRRAGLVHAHRPAGKNERQRIQFPDPIGRDVVPHDPRERMPLAHPPRDELNVLSPEIKNQDRPRRGIKRLHDDLSSVRGCRIGDDAEHPAIIKTLILPGDDTSGNPNTCRQVGESRNLEQPSAWLCFSCPGCLGFRSSPWPLNS